MPIEKLRSLFLLLLPLYCSTRPRTVGKRVDSKDNSSVHYNRLPQQPPHCLLHARRKQYHNSLPCRSRVQPRKVHAPRTVHSRANDNWSTRLNGLSRKTNVLQLSLLGKIKSDSLPYPDRQPKQAQLSRKNQLLPNHLSTLGKYILSTK